MTKSLTLLPVFADQLSHSLASLKAADKAQSVVLMVEVKEEAETVPHHARKLVFLFSAMRHFAEELRRKGWRVDYVQLDAPENSHSFTGEVARALKRHPFTHLQLTEPSEYRVLKMAQGWADQFSTDVSILNDDRFLCGHDEFNNWAAGRKSLRMEYFYREMRKKTGLLMDGDQPIGGQWNFDKDNRKPAKPDLLMPKPLRFKCDAITAQVMDMVRARFPDRYGDIDDFFYAVTRADALRALRWFVDHALPSFGDYQDAMLRGEPFLYHSLLSAYLNTGLLGWHEIAKSVEAAYMAGKAPLNAVEGYIRQIIGWREYVRGIYWREMPGYLKVNALSATRPLPQFYWTAETDMACMAEALGQTKKHAYAHHIQRLMVTGTFALIAGIDPYALHEWYLSVYIDAFEWVEAPNTIGMSQFADNGLLASKPYAASGNYINKMSDYCKGCRYDVKQRTGPDACPFNALYWDFIAHHEQSFKGNPRMAQMVRVWQRFDQAEQARIRHTAADFLDTLDP